MMGAAAAVLLGVSRAPPAAAAEGEQYLAGLVYRTGAYAPNGIPFANGMADYYALLNARDGGIKGVKLNYAECDTGYATDRGVECYERLKNNGATGTHFTNPLSTGITFVIPALTPIDQITVNTIRYGPIGKRSER